MTPAAAVAGADLVFSAVTAKQVSAAGDATGPHLQPGQIFLDINSASPAAKRAASQAVTGAGADYVEAAVMSNVPPHGHKVPMFLAGAEAEKAAALMTPFGMDVEVVGPDIAHALVATAVGLFAAIPAVMAFNYFNSSIKVLNTEMDNFSADFLNIVKRHLD